MDDARRTKADLLRELKSLRDELAKARKEAKSAAASVESAETYRSLLETIRAFLVELDDEGRVLYVSPTITEILGYTPEEYVGRGGFDIVHEDERAELLERFRKLMANGPARGVIFRDRHKDGRAVWMSSSGRVYRAADGSLRVVSIVRDVSDLEQARAALRESEERFQVMAEKASDLIAEIDGEGRVLFLGPNCRKVFGIEPDHILGTRLGTTPLARRFHPEDRASFLEAFQRGEVARGAHFLLRYFHPDGRLRWLETTATSYHTRTGEVRAVTVTRDATERVEAEERLRQSEERYRVVSEATRDLITEQDADGRVTYASPACEELLGYRPEELVGTTAMRDLTHPEDVARVLDTFERCAASEGPIQTGPPHRLVRKDGSVRWCEGAAIAFRNADGSLSVLGVTRDVTERVGAEGERRELERRMQQAQRLEGLGILAGGVAHDFNNLLTPILGEAGLALEAVPQGSELEPHLRSIQKAARRAAALTNQMLAYAGRGPMQAERIDLSSMVRELGELLTSAGGRRARLVYELRPDLPATLGDAAQLGQVAMNLITNASEALGEAGGTIAIRTGAIELPAPPAGQRLGATLGAGEHVYFEVEDSGCGMDEATLGRIFDPFFTTKFTGRGLGLAAALGIVRGHGGAIEIESWPGRGSRFRVLFPALAALPAAAPSAAGDGATWRGSGTVLLVDDDEGVREFGVAALRRCGLHVLTARDGREALEVYARRADEIDVVVLDRTLPGTAGDDVLSAIRRIRPEARVVLMSGYAEDSAGRPSALDESAGFLHKPFSHEALAREVGRVLESRPAGRGKPPLTPSRAGGR